MGMRDKAARVAVGPRGGLQKASRTTPPDAGLRLIDDRCIEIRLDLASLVCEGNRMSLMHGRPAGALGG